MMLGSVKGFNGFMPLFILLTMLGVYLNQALHNLTAFLSVMYCVVFLCRNSASVKSFFHHFKFFYVVLALYAVLYIGINAYHFGYSDDFIYALRRARWVLYLFIIVPAFSIFLMSCTEDLLSSVFRYSYIALLLISVVMISDSLLRYFFGYAGIVHILGETHVHSYRPGWVYNPILFAKICFFLVIFFLLSVFVFKTSPKRFLSILMSLLLLFIFFLAQVRGAWLGFLCVLVLGIVFLPRWRLMISLLLLVVSVGVLSHSGMRERLYHAMAASTFSEQYRLEQWKANIKLSIDNPILGVGYASNRKSHIIKPYLSDDMPSGHPHNVYIDVLSGIGWVGFVPFLVVLLWPLFYMVGLLKTVAALPRRILVGCISFHVFILIAICFDILGSIGWMCLLYSWLPAFYLGMKDKWRFQYEKA